MGSWGKEDFSNWGKEVVESEVGGKEEVDLFNWGKNGGMLKFWIGISRTQLINPSPGIIDDLIREDCGDLVKRNPGTNLTQLFKTFI